MARTRPTRGDFDDERTEELAHRETTIKTWTPSTELVETLSEILLSTVRYRDIDGVFFK